MAMMNVTLTNEMLNSILAIERCKTGFSGKKMPPTVSDKLRKISRKRSSHASTRIEGNPLTQAQASAAIDAGDRHFLKPEQEVRNYYEAMVLLGQRLSEGVPFSIDLLLEVQALVVKGESAEKVGIRGPMPPGFLFAVYDSATGMAEYIPPEACDVLPLLEELVDYLATSNDHPLIKAGVVHYQLVTIHPFEDGNGRTARLMSGYVLDFYGYGFSGIGSLEEYFAYDTDEYYRSLQMDLPALYYEGRENPPHPEIWMHYFLRMVELYARRTFELAAESSRDQVEIGLSHLSSREKELLDHMVAQNSPEYRPVDIARQMGVSNRSAINWLSALARHGFVTPNVVKKRVLSYSLTDFARLVREL